MMKIGTESDAMFRTVPTIQLKSEYRIFNISAHTRTYMHGVVA